MEIDEIIQDLNKKIVARELSVEKLEDEDLTDVEKSFLNKYKPQLSIIIYGTLPPNRPNQFVKTSSFDLLKILSDLADKNTLPSQTTETLLLEKL